MAKRLKNRAKFFCSKSAETRILLNNVDMGIKLRSNLIIFFIYVVKNSSLCSKFTLEKEVLWFFSNGLLFRNKYCGLQFLVKQKIFEQKIEKICSLSYNASFGTLTRKTWIYYLTPYVCTERIFDSRPFMYNKMFLKKTPQKLVANIFTLLLAPFASKMVNYSKHSETLNFRKNLKLTTFSFENSDLTVFKHFSKSHCASNNWPMWTKKVPKEA